MWGVKWCHIKSSLQIHSQVGRWVKSRVLGEGSLVFVDGWHDKDSSPRAVIVMRNVNL